MVYVDDFKAPLGQKLMCHMIADTTEELYAMVDKIKVPRKYIQNFGRYNVHFDICMAKRKLAVAAGAKEITSRELVRILQTRPGHPKNKKNVTS
jgi:hypothetical protein